MSYSRPHLPPFFPAWGDWCISAFCLASLPWVPSAYGWWSPCGGHKAQLVQHCIFLSDPFSASVPVSLKGTSITQWHKPEPCILSWPFPLLSPTAGESAIPLIPPCTLLFTVPSIPRWQSARGRRPHGDCRSWLLPAATLTPELPLLFYCLWDFWKCTLAPVIPSFTTHSCFRCPQNKAWTPSHSSHSFFLWLLRGAGHVSPFSFCFSNIGLFSPPDVPFRFWASALASFCLSLPETIILQLRKQSS